MLQTDIYKDNKVNNYNYKMMIKKNEKKENIKKDNDKISKEKTD
jgi:hypothetical protein